MALKGVSKATWYVVSEGGKDVGVLNAKSAVGALKAYMAGKASAVSTRKATVSDAMALPKIKTETLRAVPDEPQKEAA